MNHNHATHDNYLKLATWWWHEYPAVGRRLLSCLVDSHGANGGSSLANFSFFQLFLNFKMRPKNQNMKPKNDTYKSLGQPGKKLEPFFALRTNGKINKFSKRAKKLTLKFYVA